MYVRLERYDRFADIVNDRRRGEVICGIVGSTTSEVDANLAALGFRRRGKWKKIRKHICGKCFAVIYEANIRRK
jgi:hypothetical protein